MSDRNYGAIRSAAQLEMLVDGIIKRQRPAFGFDIEAGYVGEDKKDVSKMPFHPDWILVGVSFTDSTEWARYVPVAHDDGGNVDDVVRTARIFWKLLQTGRGVAHNLPYELKGMSRWFRQLLWHDPEVGEAVRHSLGLFPFRSDSMVEVWESGEYDPILVGKDLKSVSKKAFGLQMTEFKDLFPLEETDMGPASKKGKSQYVRFNTRYSNSPRIINYACEDSVAALMVHEKHYPEVKDTFIHKTEMALLPVHVEMEIGPVDENGNAQGHILMDWNLISRKADEVAAFRDQMTEEIMETLTERLGRVMDFNLRSVPALRKVLFDPAPEGLDLPIKMRSKETNEPSTSDDALKVIAKTDPIIKRILQWRQVDKLYGSYLDKYRKQLHYHPSGRAFPNHNQAGTGTGRFSVDGVSYQQWPKPYHYEIKNGSTFDFSFRDALIAPKGWRIVGFDFSQVELRVLAAMANETVMLEAFRNGVDIHRATASAMMGVPLDQVTKAMRAIGKTLNFAVVYGSGAENIADMLTSPDHPITKEDAEALLETYFKTFPGLRAWMDARIVEGREQGYVSTHFGRKYALWEYRSRSNYIRSKGDRMCVNAPVQGGAADYMKIGMVRAAAALKKSGLGDKVRLIMTVHDALEFYVHESVDTQTVIDLISPCVSFPVAGLPVEIKADWHEGYQWGGVAEIVMEDGKITGYELEYEVGWTGEAHKWSGETLHEVLDQYYEWESGFLGEASKYYASIRPEFSFPDVPSKQEIAEVPVRAKSLVGVESLEDIPTEIDPDDEPPWLHAKDWTPPAPEETAVLTIFEMPSVDQYTELTNWLNDRPGDTPVRLVTPEGDLTFDGTYDISAEDQPILSLMLDGANLEFLNEDGANEESMVEGLTL